MMESPVKNNLGTSVNIGPGFLGLLGLMFIGLKLTGHIDWSWWWVLSPIWIPFVFVGAIASIVLVGAMFGVATIKKKVK